MRALTIHQPWASSIAIGAKHYETRSRRLAYRGPIAIHAGKADGIEFHTAEHYLRTQLRLELPEVLVRGAVIAIADLTDVLSMDLALIAAQDSIELAVGNWAEGRFAYQLDNVRVLREPYPLRGKQGLWRVEEFDEREIRRLAGRVAA